jgi:hypothetical protein
LPALVAVLRDHLYYVWTGTYKKDPAKRTYAGEKHGTAEYINFG